MLRKFKLIVVLCVMFEVTCLNLRSDCEGCKNEYTRIKRAKYYQSPPSKYYSRPPFSPPIRGPFSYTPPPGYTANDVGSSNLPPNLRPYKVSKKPVNEGLGDEDINNLVKYLSKKDLDKIIEFANEKQKYQSQRVPIVNNYEYSVPDDMSSSNFFKNQDFENAKIASIQGFKSQEIKNTPQDNPTKYLFNSQLYGPVESSQSQIPLVDVSVNSDQISFLDTYIQKEIKDMTFNKSDIYTDSSIMQDESLPRPVNLRDTEFEISFTNNVPSVAKPESSYKLENFADLPLMDYQNSKLHSGNSYSVPHYSVTSSKNQNQVLQSQTQSLPLSSMSSPLSSSLPLTSSLPSNINVQVEPAPPASLVKDQSDAHLKATKIWTHRSKGTAYTLHDDGTLTLEKPTRPKFKFN